MSAAAAPTGPDRYASAPIASRRTRPSGRKNAHRGLAACRRPASGKPRSQALIASGKNRRSPTTARRSHLLQQSNPQQCPAPAASGSFASNFRQNFVETNAALPGSLAPTGSGAITSGALSESMWGTGAFTAGRYVFSGLRGATMGTATFTSFETGLIVAYTSAVNFAATGTAFEAGAAVGSAISAIPTGNGNTVSSSLGGLLYSAFGPKSAFGGPSTCGN